jgi:phosphoribosylformylglycinamidine synthase
MGPETIIMWGMGINCDKETAFAFEKAGADTRIVHIDDLINNRDSLDNCKILVWPGGFSMGDDTGSGLAYANLVKDNLRDQLAGFRQRDTLSIGICNGFQIMTHLGFFPVDRDSYGTPETALVFNDNARYTDRWVHLANRDKEGRCVWTRGVKYLSFPIAHAEGRFYADKDTMKRLRKSGQIVFKYVTEDYKAAKGGPANPNGSLDDIAGICDPTGRFMGMMPHPERAIFSVQHNLYTLNRELAKRQGRELPDYTEVMKIFQNAVDYFR